MVYFKIYVPVCFRILNLLNGLFEKQCWECTLCNVNIKGAVDLTGVILTGLVPELGNVTQVIFNLNHDLLVAKML